MDKSTESKNQTLDSLMTERFLSARTHTTPLSPRKQRVFRIGPEPSRARSGEANPLTARTDPYNPALRERGVEGQGAKLAKGVSIDGYSTYRATRFSEPV